MASSSTPLAPQILSRAALPSLIQALDASDVLECYHLTRHAPLHMQQQHDDDNDNSSNNSTNTRLVVTKSAIGLRYQGQKKQPLQLTLEYGPQRVGIEQTEEATPILSSNYMTWQNEAKVYYTLHLIPGEWNAAQYMASITGTVLEKLLQHAVEYVDTHRRYQPLVVVHNNNNHTNNNETIVIKSSNSHDFLQSTWEFLATLGVQLQPLLPPRVFVARLFVEDVQRVASGDFVGNVEDGNTNASTMVVSQHASTIYTKLQQCVMAIATGDYSRYEEPPNDTSSLSFAPTMTPTLNDDNDNNDDTTEESEHNDNDDSLPPRELAVASVSSSSRWIQEDDIENDYGDNDDDNDELPTTDNDQDDSTTSTPAPSMVPPPPLDTSIKEANEAAQEAKVKAHEAKEAANTIQDEEAANAAQAAANAAQKAAHVTSQKQQQVAQTNLLSGNGELMVTSLQTCFTNPQYQLVSSEDSSALLYLYLDGATYYRLNLTMPYMDVIQVDRPIPQPPLKAGSGGGDFVDWTLALVTIGFLLAGIVLVFQRIGFKFLPPLYNMQKWFFSPTESDYDSEEEEAMKMGQGFEHAFGEDVIPFSMGGRRPGLRQRRQVLPGSELYIDTSNGHDEGGHGAGDVEMVGEHALVPASMRGRSMSSDDGALASQQTSGSNHSSRRLSGPIIMEIPQRLSRDPDLVDLPNLSSKSKVAVPVSIEQQQSRNASDADGSANDDSLDSSQEGSFA